MPPHFQPNHVVPSRRPPAILSLSNSLGRACSLLLLFVASVLIPPDVHAGESHHSNTGSDWLVDSSPYIARAGSNGTKNELELSNGLVRRVFRLKPNGATVALDNLMTDEALLRSVKPEAEVTIDGIRFDVGGLTNQPIQNFLKPAWLEQMSADPKAFQLTNWKIGKTEARFPWKKRREWMPDDLPWPPPGVSLTLEYRPPADSAQPNGPIPSAVIVEVHYELYDGIPLLCKWLAIKNGGSHPIRLNSFVSEILGVVEGQSAVGDAGFWQLPNIHVETDYAFGGSMSAEGSAASVHWVADPQYTSQVNYDLKTPCLLKCHPPIGPDQVIEPGGKLETFRTFELIHDSTDRERIGLAQRRMYRTIAPWVTENPVIMHVRSAKPEAVRLALDQCAKVGFELLIFTFGSGFDFESRDRNYQNNIKELADYARSKGIALGGYSLLASRGGATSADNTVGKTMFGVMPCLGAQWGVDYLSQLRSFITNAGLSVLEHDGSYPGDTCASTAHPFHRGLEDSQWVQWQAITRFYEWCRCEGVYLNIPDWYFLTGGNKTGMGYREVNWSLPREYQEIIERQNIYDGTWEKTPSMGWMFVPLTEYQGGGAAATIEPLKEHLPHYEQRLANLFGAGVIACYRGPRLYDSEETETVVKKWVNYYKQHRAILNSDIVHLRRPDGRDWDGWLHVNAKLPEKALGVIYNPLPEPITRTLLLPLHYTGLNSKAKVTVGNGKPRIWRLDATQNAELKIEIPANHWQTILVQAP